ncbi:C3 and PZP-like alpha-2-macroglobulin domain-containing protein 8 [Anabrus simplex]|uniref:C3 and PZP-like alpha-2-macroglobulin domain-containing protein 8 n=1 Tax=Anabrus simplex TaxID=316456 RepID=UPI0035A2C01B
MPILLIVPFHYFDRGFSVVAPELAVPGKTTAVLITLHGASRRQPLNVTLRLVSDRVEEVTQVLAQTTREIRGHGIIPLAIRGDATGSCILQTIVNCSASDDCSLQTSSELRLVGAVRDVIIRPGRRHYRPGETVFFWVLALDHDLQVASDVIGNVFVREPSGAKVALWEEEALDEGVKSYSLPLSNAAQLGTWLLQVEVDSVVFSADFNVSLTAVGLGGSVPEVAMAEEHYVELRFGTEMRRLYKPGLPFVGKVEAVSTEKCVRVRVKVYDNTTAIYSQDIEITSGEGMFVVPAILADSEVITLQAELVSVEGKEIDSHYVLAREPIRKWNSSSDCYLLIEGMEHTLQPDEEANVVVLSTCPCDRDMHYVITTEGHVTYWSQRQSPDSGVDDPPTQAIDGAAICRLNFSFTVQSVMAPVSHLLVYYVTEEGEPISDVISFDVKLLLKQVSLSSKERKYWLPGQTMPVRVTAEPGALVCLLGGRAGATESRLAPIVTTVSHRRAATSRELDFLEAGVAFFQRQCQRRRESHSFLYRREGAQWHRSVVGGAGLDQLWLWRCFNYSSEAAVSVVTPEETGKWAVWALTLSPGAGLRFSAPLPLTVFRPLTVAFNLPNSLRVGETVEVDVRIGNNINSCMDVTALLALTEGAHFLSNGMLYVTEKLRLGPHGATSLVVRVVVTSAGAKNMTVEVSGYASDSCRDSSSASVNNTLVGSVLRSATIMVHHEGLVRTSTESAYFCANENVVISTSEDFRYEFISAPRNRAGLVFEVKVDQGAHIALSDVRYTSDRMYQVVLADLSWIGRGKHGYGVHLARSETPHLLSPESFRTFWVSWEHGTVAVGRGPLPHQDTLLKWRMDKKLRVQHIGFASSWGHTAEFRIWNYNDEAGFSQVLHLNVPHPVVPGSETGILSIAGGLALPSAAHWPVQPHSTSLAATISTFSSLPVLEHAQYLANDSWHREQVIQSLNMQIQALLAFRKADNSFGDHYLIGSHRNTVIILELLSKMQAYVSVDPELLSGMKRWLQLRQEKDGHYTILPTDESTGQCSLSDIALLNRDVEVTAETLATLLQVGLENEVDSENVLRARYFLERNLFRVTSPSSIALLTYALVLGKSELSHMALDKLRNASTNEEGDFGWTHPPTSRDAPDWLYEEGSGRHHKEPIMTSVGEFRASLFTLMTYSKLGDLKSAEPVARYLFYRSHLLDRHIELLYLAVKAFSAFSALALDQHRTLTVSLATSGMELTDTLELRNAMAPQQLQLPSLPTKVFVYATGAGCATVQGQVSYSTYAPASRTHLLDLWAGVEGEIIPSHNSLEELEGKLPILRLKICFRWKGDSPSGVLRLEITLFSGFQLDLVSPVAADVHHGYQEEKVWFVLANVSSACPLCVRFTARSMFVVSALRPAFARVYPADREDLGAETFFHTEKGSSLLADITDDDLITWFGKTDRGEPHPSSNFSDMCECGQVCPITDSDPSSNNTNITQNDTHLTLTRAEEAVMNISKTKQLPLEFIKRNISKEDESLNDSLSTEAVNNDVLLSAEQPVLRFKPVIYTKSAKSAVVATNISSDRNSVNRITVNRTTENENSTDDPMKTSSEPKSDESISPSTTSSAQQVRSINKEKHHTSEDSSPSTSQQSGISEAPEEDKLFILDRNTLWGMLREVVDVELSKQDVIPKTLHTKIVLD